MWKCKSVQVSTERGTIGTSIGTLSRLTVADGWNISVDDREILAERDGFRLRIPRELVVVEEVEVEEPKPAKRVREVA